MASKYKCSYCQKEFAHPNDMDKCRLSHNLVYIELTKEDLNRLNLFLFSGDTSLITETMSRSIRKAQFGRGV